MWEINRNDYGLAMRPIEMTVKCSVRIVSIILTTILATDFGLFLIPASSSESVEQERTFCLAECKAKFGMDIYASGGGGTGVDWRLYFMCIENCERKFWKEWQKNMDELEKE